MRLLILPQSDARKMSGSRLIQCYASSRLGRQMHVAFDAPYLSTYLLVMCF